MRKNIIVKNVDLQYLPKDSPFDYKYLCNISIKFNTLS